MFTRLFPSGGFPTRSLGNASDFLVDFIYPRRCGGCGQRGTWLCTACDGKLERFYPPWCSRCGVSTHLHRCSCADLAIELSWARAIGPFEGWLRGAIVQLKYHGEWSRGQHLAEVLAPALADTPIDILVPVPLHESRLKRRGFNQSFVLAKDLAPLIEATVDDCLFRTRRTPSQTTLGAAVRRRNVAGAFGLPEIPDYSGMSVALVDDVLTTGSTIGECVRILQASGASSIGAVTLARELS